MCVEQFIESLVLVEVRAGCRWYWARKRAMRKSRKKEEALREGGG